MTRTFLAAAALAVTVAAPALSDTFDFASLPSGYLGSTALSMTEGEFTSFGDDIFVNNTSNWICALLSGSCVADLRLEFNGLASNLSFRVGGWDTGDYVLAALFDASDGLLETVAITANSTYSFASSGIASIYFVDYSSQSGGVFYADWYFDLTGTPAVPVPAGLPLILGALGAFGLVRSRQKS